MSGTSLSINIFSVISLALFSIYQILDDLGFQDIEGNKPPLAWGV